MSMSRIMIVDIPPKASYGCCLPVFHRTENYPPHTIGETTMSKQQEHEIYCRLAKELIESRLAVEPTQLRIHRLAKVIQLVDSEVAAC